jgi:hypothetical protein
MTTPISRRTLLGSTAAVGVGVGVGVTAASGSPAEAAERSHRPWLPSAATGPGCRPETTSPPGPELTLLGTSGGPPPDYVRTGISSVLSVGGRIYVVDAGRSSASGEADASRSRAPSSRATSRTIGTTSRVVRKLTKQARRHAVPSTLAGAR